MSKNQIRMYNNKVFGEEVSGYGLSKGYLDYYTLSKLVGDRILNNTVWTTEDYWDLLNGNDEDCEIYQFYIISERGSNFLKEFTDEIVYYNDNLDIYLWGITHFGTSWDYVLTNIELV